MCLSTAIFNGSIFIVIFRDLMYKLYFLLDMDYCLWERHIFLVAHYYSIMIQVFEGSRHEVLHDKDQDRARQLISDWVLEKLASTPCDTPPSNEQAETTEQAESTKQAETTEQAETTHEQAETTEQAEITEQAETTEQAESPASEA